MLDLLIKGGTVVDGTGGPRRIADVAVRDGRVVAIGKTDEAARKTLDATGLLICPGFVDLHTHYDAQLFWDPTASPSPLHGVTTVLGGNCGFTVAPSTAGDATYLMRMMSRVEGMPLAALEAGLTWDWRSFGEWLQRLDGNIGVNAGFLVGHSALRRVVMGEHVMQAASDDEVASMAALLHDALTAGGLGLSTSTAPTHNDAEGDPVPSRFATDEELVTLAAAVRHHPGTTLELILAGCLNQFSVSEIALMTDMSVAADRPVNWNVLNINPADPSAHEHQLSAADRAAERGGRIVALTIPYSSGTRLSFHSAFVLDGLPGWRPVMSLPIPERMQALRDPAVRQRLAEGARSPDAGVLAGLAVWANMQISETFAADNAGLAGRPVGEIAAERNLDPFDAMLDIVLADGLRTGLRPGGANTTRMNDDELRLRAEVWKDSRTVIGGSDAGAHLDMMCGAIYTTAFLAEAVRERQVLTIEEAVHQLSDVPARLYGLTNRGRIAEGYWADLVLLDLDTVGHTPVHTVDDLPGGASRLYAGSTGIETVLVNGVSVVEGGRLTGALAGKLMRSGVDTETVHASSTGG